MTRTRTGVGLIAASAFLVSCGGDVNARNEERAAGTAGASALDLGGGGQSARVDGDGRAITPNSDFEVCAGVSEQAENTRSPADIVFLVDNSPSMRDEIAWTRENLNDFSRQIVEQGIDARIVMLSCLRDGCDGHANAVGICIEQPVGSGDCETSDTNLPNYLHWDSRMPSNKLLGRAISSYAEYRAVLRPAATTHFVAISDDADASTAQEFTEQLARLDPPVTKFVFHGIFSSMSKEAACALPGGNPCCSYAAPGGEGASYRDLAEGTGGIAADLCAQDFAPVFDLFAHSVVAHSELNCDWSIPEPPVGQLLDPNLVNVEFHSNGVVTALGYLGSPGDCGSHDNAWYYDDPAAPMRVVACPATCERIRDGLAPRMVLTFGCRTVELDAIL